MYAQLIGHLLSRTVFKSALGKTTRSILSWMFPAQETDLSQDEIEQLAPLVDDYMRKRNHFFFIIPPIIVLLLAYPIIWIEEWTSIPIANPIWSDRGGLGMIFAALMLAWVSVPLFSRIHARRHWRENLHTFDRYAWAKFGYDHNRVDRFFGIIFTVPTILLAVTLWHAGEAIGENGIAFKDGIWKVYYYSYDDVGSVARFDKLRAPVGVVDFANLQIGFNDGKKVIIRKGKGGQDYAASLDNAASYISTRSGLPLVKGDIPPNK